MTIDWFLIFEIVYILSAVITAVAVPLRLAERRRYRKSEPIRFYMTYGHIAKGIVFAVIPVVNTFLSAVFIHDQLDGIRVFKERKYEDS